MVDRLGGDLSLNYPLTFRVIASGDPLEAHCAKSFDELVILIKRANRYGNSKIWMTFQRKENTVNFCSSPARYVSH